MIRPTILIGIDTGVNTGYAVYSRPEKRLLEVASMKIHQALEKVLIMKRWYGPQLLVRLEDARLRKWIPRQKTESAERGRREGAGSVKRDASIWEDFLTDQGIFFELVPPRNNRTKVTQAYFARITGWVAQANGHGRDAAMLVYGH